MACFKIIIVLSLTLFVARSLAVRRHDSDHHVKFDKRVDNRKETVNRWNVEQTRHVDANGGTTVEGRVRTFPPVPAPGVHPRVHLTPDELPALREHLKTSKMGQVAAPRLLQALELRLTTPPLAPLWKKLVAGDSSNATENAFVEAYHEQWPFIVSQTAGTAAFLQCAVYQNSSECTNAAAATAAFAEIVSRNLDKVRRKSSINPVQT